MFESLKLDKVYFGGTQSSHKCGNSEPPASKQKTELAELETRVQNVSQACGTSSKAWSICRAHQRFRTLTGRTKRCNRLLKELLWREGVYVFVHNENQGVENQGGGLSNHP